MPEHTPAPTPSRAVYGFALHLACNIFFVFYVLWAIIPEEWFEAIGITYLPQRYWAIAIPMFLLTMLALFGMVIYPSLGLCMAVGVDDIRTVTDEKAIKKEATEFMTQRNVGGGECTCSGEKCGKAAFEKIRREVFIKNSVPPIYDLDPIVVSEHLYL